MIFINIIRNKKVIIISSIVLIFILLTWFIFSFNKEIKVYAEEVPVIKEDIKQSNLISIDVKGQVVNPGVYRVNEGYVINDIISIAGGLSTNADTSIINLSKKLVDEMVVIIPSYEEITKIKNDDYYLNLKQVDIDNYLKTTYDNLIKESLKSIIDNKVIENEIDGVTNKKISINTANLEELQLIPNIGESKALDIIKYREENNQFKTLDELKNIKGIGDATFEKIKDHITL